MKKVRDFPDCLKQQINTFQTPEGQSKLQALADEPGQLSIALGFMGDRRDDDAPLSKIDYEILQSCNKPLSHVKHTIWEEGDEVVFSYGKLTLRNLISWELHTTVDGGMAATMYYQNG